MNTLSKILSALLLLGMTAGNAPAADTIWMGKDNDGYRYVFTQNGGKNWTVSINGQRAPYKETTRTDDYIELTMQGENFPSIRFYSDKFYIRTEKNPKWVYMGKGKWTD